VLANARCVGFFSSSGYALGLQNDDNDEEREDERTEIIYAVTEIGVATDFIKAHTMYNFEDYKWNLNPCLIKIMCADNTRIHYLSEKQVKKKNAIVINSVDDLMDDLGMSIDIAQNKNLKITNI
jgi:hypothetical protein